MYGVSERYWRKRAAGGGSEVTPPPRFFDIRRLATVKQPDNPVVVELSSLLQPFKVLGWTLTVDLIGRMLNWNSYPGHAIANYYLHRMGSQLPTNEKIYAEPGKWYFVPKQQDWFNGQWDGEWKGIASLVRLPAGTGYPLRLSIALKEASDLKEIEKIVVSHMTDILSTNAHWQMDMGRPAVNGLHWAFLVLSARAVKYELQPEVLGVTKSTLKRTREAVLGLYGGRISHATTLAACDGIVQSWHLQSDYVRFNHEY